MCSCVEINGYNVYFINHCLLINNLYIANCKSNTIYKLNESVFNFKKKLIPSKSERKRKKQKKPLSNSNCPVLDKDDVLHNEQDYKSFILQFQDDIEKLKEIVNSCLINKHAFIQEYFKSSKVQNEIDFELFLENTTSFPKMHGINQLNENKIIELSGIKYVIPPKSSYFNIPIEEINEIYFNKTFDFIVIDPPWRNKYIRRLKKSKFKSHATYKMLYNTEIQNIPIEKLKNDNSIVVVWCTNSYQHQKAILEDFLPKWKLKLITKYYWIKLSKHENGDFDLMCDIQTEFGKKQPFEIFFVACSENSKLLFPTTNKINVLFSVPSLIHSHKPPLIELFKEWLPNGTNLNCIELFARYLQPNFISIGLEVLKLMDLRLYDCEELND